MSVVMPAYNEQAVIAETVSALDRALSETDFDCEILVVNDGSTDRTEAILEQLVATSATVRFVTNPGPNGYGHAVRHGLDHYSGDAVAVVMADGSDRPADVIRYFEAIREGHDCAFGTRFSGGTTVTGYPWFKLALNRIGNWLIARLVGRDYDDFTNGFKCFRRPVIDGMRPLVSGQFNLTVEMSLKAVLSGASFAVVPNDWTQRAGGQSKFKVLSLAWLYLLTIAYCLIGHRLTRLPGPR